MSASRRRKRSKKKSCPFFEKAYPCRNIPFTLVPRGNISVTRALAIFIRQEDAREPARKLLRNFLECKHFLRTYWTLYFQLIAVEMVVAFECLDDQVIDREPNRAAPVRVAPEEVAGAFAGHVIHPMFLVPGDEDVGLVAMDARDRAQTVG